MLFAFWGVPSVAHAATYTWDGGGDGSSWVDPLNWDLDLSYPGFDSGQNDVVVIGTGNTVTLQVQAQIDQLQLSDGATLTLSGSGQKLIVVTSITITNDNGASQAIVQGAGRLITGASNSSTTLTLNAATDSLKIARLEINNGTGALSLSANSVVTVDTTLDWTDGDFTLGAGSDLEIPGMTIPSGETLTCNSATIYAQDTWTFDGTFSAGTGTVVFVDDAIISGTSSPTFNNLTIRPNATVTQQVAINLSGTWFGEGVFDGSGYLTTITSSMTLQGEGTNQFEDLTVNAGQTMTLSTTGSNAAIHILDTLQIEGVLACTGPNVITVDGTWDNNNGAAGFDQGPNPAGNAEGSRVVFAGANVNLPDVDETFMDLEIKSSVKALARASYTINRTWWGTKNTFDPATHTVTFDTSLEHTSTASTGTFDRGILSGTAIFKNVHIQSNDTISTNPNKRLMNGAVLIVDDLRIDSTYFVFHEYSKLKIGSQLVVGPNSHFVTTALGGLTAPPTISDRGSGFSFVVKDSGRLNMGSGTIRNLNSAGLVFEQTANTTQTMSTLSFVRDDPDPAGVYISYDKTTTSHAWVALAFDGNTANNIRTRPDYTGIITLTKFSGAKSGEAYEDDKGVGSVANSTIRWTGVYHWRGNTSDSFFTASNWYDVDNDQVALAAPNLNITCIVSTDALNQARVDVASQTVGSLQILSGGVVTSNGVAGFFAVQSSIYIEEDKGSGPGVLNWVGNGSGGDYLLPYNGVENHGELYNGTVFAFIGGVENYGLIRNSSSTDFLAQNMGSIVVFGDIRNRSGATYTAGAVRGTACGGDWINSGTYEPGTARLSMFGRNVDIDNGTDDIYELRVRGNPYAIKPVKLNMLNDISVLNQLIFEDTLVSDLYINVTKSLVFLGAATLETSDSGTIEFSGTAAQTIPIPPAAGDDYYNLAISNTHASGACLSAGVTTVDKAMTIAGGNLVGTAGATLRLAGGDWSNDEGSFSPSTSRVILGGAGTRTILGTSVTTFFDLSVENSTTMAINVRATGRINEIEIGGTLHNDGILSVPSSTFIFTGAPATSLTGTAATTFDTIKVTGTFNAGSSVFGVSDTFWNTGTFNAGTSSVHFTGTDCQLTGTTAFNVVTLDGAKLTLASGDDMTITERMALETDSTLSLNDNAIMRFGKGLKIYGTFTSDGATPIMTDTGSDFAVAISGSSATVDIDKIQIANPDNNGLVVESNVTNSQIDFDGMSFTNDDLAQTGTYLQLQQTTIAANQFTFSTMSFDNNCQYNISTVNNGGVVNNAVTITGYTGARGEETYENDKGGGEVTDQSILWPKKLWVGSTDSGWNTATNWSPAGVPGPTDTVLIQNITAGNSTPIIDTSIIVINSLTVGTGAVISRDASLSNVSMTLVGNLVVKEDEGFGVGTMQFSPGGASTLSINGDFQNNGTFGNDAANLVLGGSLTNTSNLTSDGTSITIQGSVVNSGAGSLTTGNAITVVGDWTNSATFIPGSGTVTFNGTGSISPGGQAFYNVDIPSGKSPVSAQAFSVSNVLSVQGTLSLQDSLTFGNRFDEWTGTLAMTGTGSQTVPVERYYNLIINKAAGTASLATGTTQIDGDLTLSLGTFDAGAARLELGGHLINNSTFTESTSAVVFAGSGSQEIQGTVQTNFHVVTIDSGATMSFNNTAVPIDTAEIGGSWTNNGVFVPGLSTIKFTSSACEILGNTTTTFDTVQINGGAMLTISNSNNRIDVQSAFANSGSYVAGSSTISFVGSALWSGSSATIVSVIEVLDSLTIGAGDDVTATTFRVWNTGSATLSGTAVLRMASAGTLDIKGMLTSSGSTPTLTSVSGQFTFDVQNGGGLSLDGLNLMNLDDDGIHINTTASASIDIDNVAFTDATIGAVGTYIKWERASPTSGQYVFSGLSFDANCQFNMESPGTSQSGAFILAGYGGANGGSGFENDRGAGTDDSGSSSINWPQVVWDGEAGTNNWSNATNWNPDGIPSASDNVLIPTTPASGTGHPMIDLSTAVGSLTIEDGASVTADTGSRNLTVNGTVIIEENNGSGKHGYLTFDSSGILRIDSLLSIDGHFRLVSGGTLDLNAGLTAGGNSFVLADAGSIGDVEGTVTSSGTLQVDVMTIAGDFDLSGGTFTAGTSVVSLDGGSGTVDIGSGSFYRLSIPLGSTYTTDSTNTLTVSNRLVVGGTLQVAGPISIVGTLDPITGTVRYSGTNSQTIDPQNYYALEVTNTTGNVSFGAGTTSVAGDFTCSASTSVFGATALVQVTGDWINNGSFSAQTCSASFDGSASEIKGSSLTTFNDLYIASGAILTVNCTTTPSNQFALAGNFRNDGVFQNGSGSVLFTSTCGYGGSSVTTFDSLSITTGSTLTMLSGRFDWADTFSNDGLFSAGTSTVGTAVGAGVSLDGAQAVTFLNLEVLGNLTVANQDIAATNCNVWGTGSLALDGPTTMTLGTGVSKGTLNIRGSLTSSGSTPTITHGGLEYNFDVLDGGTVNLDSLVVDNPDDDGLHINSTASSSFDADNVSFTNGNSGSGTYLTISLAGIPASTYNFNVLNFDANCQYNISTPASASNSALNCPGAGGTKSGEQFENDKGSGTVSPGSIVWPEKTWDGSEGSKWTNINNWTPAGLPSAAERCVIPDQTTSNGHSPYFNGAANVGSIIVEDGGTLTSDGTGHVVVVNGSLEVEADYGLGLAALTFDSSGGSFTAQSISNDGVLRFADATISINGDVRNTAWLTNDATSFDVDGSILSVESSAHFAPGRLVLAGDFVARDESILHGSGSVITLDGVTQQTVTGDAPLFGHVHVTNSNYVTFAASSSIESGLHVHSGAVTFSGVTLTFDHNAVVDVFGFVTLDNAVFVSSVPGLTRFAMTIHSGGDLRASQTSRFDSLVAAGLYVKSGATLGAGSNAGFSYITFDNVVAGGVALDVTDLAAVDAAGLPDLLDEVRFNGSGSNIRSGSTTPTMALRVLDGDFGTLAADGESGDDDTAGVITWGLYSGSAPALVNVTINDSGSQEQITFTFDKAVLPGSTTLADWLLLASDGVTNLMPGTTLTITGNTVVFTLPVGVSAGGSIYYRYFGSNLADLFGNTVVAFNSGSDPTVTAPPNQQGPPGYYAINVSFDDVDGGPVSLDVAWISGPAPVTVLDQANQSVGLTADGTYVFAATVTDNVTRTAQVRFNVTIDNIAPVPAGFTLIQLRIGDIVTLNGTGTSDGNGSQDITALRWWSVAGPSIPSLTQDGTSGVATFDTSSLTPGIYTFNLQVTDDNAATASLQAEVLLQGSNHIPYADAGIGGRRRLTTIPFPIRGHESIDTESVIVNYAWNQLTGPEGTLTGPSATSPYFTPSGPGIHTFSMVVTDPTTQTSRVSYLTWIIDDHDRDLYVPNADVGGNLVVSEDDVVTLDGSASADARGQSLTYAWTQTAGPGVSLDNSTLESPTIRFDLPGRYVFSLVVSNDHLASVPVTKTILVSGIGSAPSANAGVDQTANTWTWVTLDGTGSVDANGDTLEYHWTQVMGPAVSFDGRLANPTFPVQRTRVYGFELQVHDGTYTSTADRVYVLVKSIDNTAPTAIAGTSAGNDVETGRLGDRQIISGVLSSDPNFGDQLKYVNWVQLSGPPALLENPHDLVTSFEAHVAGLYVFELYVDDGGDRSIPDLYTLSIPASSGSSGGLPASLSDAKLCLVSEPGKLSWGIGSFWAAVVSLLLLNRRRQRV